MFKLTLALLSVGAIATRTSVHDDDCYGPWNWEECSLSYKQEDFCRDECGWWYSPENDDDWDDDYWVTCEMHLTWMECGPPSVKEGEDSCYGPLNWEECSGAYWQSDHCLDDCGWWYSPEADDDWGDDWWVSCDEFSSWEYC